MFAKTFFAVAALCLAMRVSAYDPVQAQIDACVGKNNLDVCNVILEDGSTSKDGQCFVLNGSYLNCYVDPLGGLN